MTTSGKSFDFSADTKAEKVPPCDAKAEKAPSSTFAAAFSTPETHSTAEKIPSPTPWLKVIPWLLPTKINGEDAWQSK